MKYKVRTEITNISNFKPFKRLEIIDGKASFLTNNIKNKTEFDEVEYVLKNKIKSILDKYLISIIFLLIFIIMLYVIKSSIITIKFTNIKNDEVLNDINEKIRYYKIFGFLKEDINEINKMLKQKYYYYEWINIKKVGTTLEVDIKNTTSDYIKDNNKCDYLISKYDGFVIGYYVKSGTILIDINETIKQGDKVIGGYINAYNSEIIKTNPEGYVICKTNYIRQFKIPKKEVSTIYSGIVKFKYTFKKQNKQIFNNQDVKEKEVFNFLGIKLYYKEYYEKVRNTINYTQNDAIKLSKSMIENEFLTNKKYDFEKINYIKLINVLEYNTYYKINYLVNANIDVTR